MLKKTLEDETASHEAQIVDLRQKHNSSIENLNEQLDSVKKVSSKDFYFSICTNF